MPNFNDICGQTQLKEHLKNSLIKNQISHAYIINGEKFSGKEYIAGIFAMALLCGNKNQAEPCNECHSCRQAMTKNNPDIIYVTHEKPTSISVDEIRIQINGDVAIKPYAGEHKIYIVNEAEKMTPAAQNALLKTLEEPPEYVVIILLTTNVNSMLPTILSRCVTLNIKPVDDDTVEKFLMEKKQIPDYKAYVCAAFARGNIGKAILLSESEDFDNIKSKVLSIMKQISQMDVSGIYKTVKELSENKTEIDDFFDIMSIWFRDVLLYKAEKNRERLIFKEELNTIKEQAEAVTYEGLEEITQAIDKAKRRLEFNVNYELTLEMLLIEMKEKLQNYAK